MKLADWDALEPGASNIKHDHGSYPAAAYSIAISLKRIADALTDKTLAETLTTAIFNGVNDGTFNATRK